MFCMKVKLLQWNIWFKEDIDNVVNELKRINADIVCLQEVCIKENDRSNIEKIKAIYPYVYYRIADTFEDGLSQGNAILSKFEIVNEQGLFVQDASENENDYSKEGRIYIEVDININCNILKIGTTHLSYTDRFIETKLKDKEINKLINIIKDKNKNYIFAGDLNTTKTSKYIDYIKKYLIHYDTSNTWTTKEFSYNGFEETKLNWKLDYIFSTPDIKIENIKLYKTDISDHLPIIAEFVLKENL